MKFSSQNETRINEFYKKGNTKPLLKENRILNEAIADEALAAEEMIAIFISNQKQQTVYSFECFGFKYWNRRINFCHSVLE
jgi:hypothetical protein